MSSELLLARTPRSMCCSAAAGGQPSKAMLTWLGNLSTQQGDSAAAPVVGPGLPDDPRHRLGSRQRVSAGRRGQVLRHGARGVCRAGLQPGRARGLARLLRDPCLQPVILPFAVRRATGWRGAAPRRRGTEQYHGGQSEQRHCPCSAPPPAPLHAADLARSGRSLGVRSGASSRRVATPRPCWI